MSVWSFACSCECNLWNERVAALFGSPQINCTWLRLGRLTIITNSGLAGLARAVVEKKPGKTTACTCGLVNSHSMAMSNFGKQHRRDGFMRARNQLLHTGRTGLDEIGMG